MEQSTEDSHGPLKGLLGRDDVQLASMDQMMEYDSAMTLNLEMYLMSEDAQKQTSKLITEAT